MFTRKTLSRLFAQFPSGPAFKLDGRLTLSLRTLAEREQRSVEEVAASLIAAGLDQYYATDARRQYWQSLSPREQDVTALTCLNHTNRQIAARLHISVETVKTHIHNALAKFNLHSKAELRQALADWDFSEWNLPQRWGQR